MIGDILEAAFAERRRRKDSGGKLMEIACNFLIWIFGLLLWFTVISIPILAMWKFVDLIIYLGAW
jgi:hypothetical protein